MKIVILEKEETLKVGGIGIHNQRLAKYLTNKGHEVTFIRFSKKRIRNKRVVSIPYYLAEKRTFIFLPVENTKELLEKELLRIKPDLIHFCLGISPFDFFTPSLSHSLKIPIVGILHMDLNTKPTPVNLFLKSLYLAYLPVCKQLDSLIVFTEKMKNFYLNKGLTKDRLDVIPNGVDGKLYSPTTEVNSQKSSVTNTILSMGRITVVKNPELLIRSFQKADVPNSRLIIAGTGDLENVLKEKYASDKRIVFTGLIKNERKKVELFQSAGIFVLPSITEGMSLSLLEAMSCGLACIASDAGGNSEALDKSGIIIDVDSLENDLPFALRLLLEHKDFQKSLGRSARKRALDQFNEEQIFSRYEKLYKRTLERFGKDGPPGRFSQELYLTFSKKFKNLWEKARDFSENYLLG